jgi:hypothetical protein
MKATALTALALAGCAVGLVVAGAGAQVPPGQTSPEYQQTTPTTTTTTPTTTPAPPDDTTPPGTQPGAGQQPGAGGEQPSGSQAPSTADRGTRTLPLTGLPARTIAALGLLFVAAGLVLRRLSTT